MFCDQRRFAFAAAAPAILTACLISSSVLRESAQAVPRRDVDVLLDLPLTSRLKELRTEGAEGYRSLRKISLQGGGYTTEARWRATLAMAQLGGRESLPDLKVAVKSKEWFLRAAALEAALLVDRPSALSWSRELINDPAMMVRLHAVRAIDRLVDIKAESLLWKELSSKRNFHHGQSLFIRPHIVSALSRVTRGGDVVARSQAAQRLLPFLNDQDPGVRRETVAALESLEGHRLGQPGDGWEKRRLKWISWAQTQGSLIP